MKVRVDLDTCVGHGRCYVLAPEVFGPDEYGHSEVLLDEVPPELHEKARIAEANCPERAISIED